MIVFTLNMPHRGSWNGRWSGEGKIYARIFHNNDVPKILLEKIFIITGMMVGALALVLLRLIVKKLQKLEINLLDFVVMTG